MISSLYIHIPFCKKKCSYCDFASYAGKEDLIDEYVDSIINEIQSLDFGFLSRAKSRDRISDLETIFIGGGTPTLLQPEHFEKILCSIPYALCSEISVEANPGTVDKAYLKDLKDLGVNRLSLGAQSFNDKHLKTLGRIHNSKDIYQAVKDARAAGFDNLNFDLIFCLPGQTLDEWKEDLEKALTQQPNHLSTYNLMYEEGTPLYKLRDLKDEDLDAQMYEYTIDKLKEKGFHHYEISNFARPGRECRHNITYWKNGDYLGVGCAAHSHVKGKRWANPDSVEDYLNSPRVDRTLSPADAALRVPPTRNKKETLFMGLRLLDGIELKHFDGFQDKLDDLLDKDLLEKKNGKIKLSRKGLFLGNLVFESFV